jgi:phage shock protein A
MSWWSRICLALRVKGHVLINNAENPRELLAYAGEQQQELLRKVKQGLLEVAISKRQLQQQVEKLRARVPQLEDQAKRALAAGREDLARHALERKQLALGELMGLETQVAEVAEEERRLSLAEQKLAARIDDNRTRRHVMNARYTAAEAQVRVNESLSGVSQDFADLGAALERAEEKMGGMIARASALDSLIDGGILASPIYADGDVVERELRKHAGRASVEEELSALRSSLGPGTQPPALSSGS